MQSRTLILLLTILVAAPAASATWAGKGMWEPDTRRDALDGYMRASPDQVNDGVSRVYFNIFSTHSAGFHAEVATSVNPNSGTAQTSYLTSTGRWFAMLGVWKDCNKDGFVGWGDQGLWEYRVELLNVPNVEGFTPGTSVCPAVTPPNPLPAGHTYRWPHNDGTWVHEWIPIGYDITLPTLPDDNPTNIRDSGSRVWIDWGLPDSPANTRCYGFQPQGTFRSTGGLIEYADCFTGFKATDTYNAQTGGLDGTGGNQISFDDKPRDQSESTSIANAANPWGDENGASHADAFDCTDPLVPTQNVSMTEIPIMVPRPVVPSFNPSGTIGGTLSEAENDFEDCDRSDNGQFGLGGLPYSPERPIVNTNDLKRNTDFTMDYNEGCRRNAIAAAPTCTYPQLGRATPKDLGTRATDPEGFWTSTTVIGEDRSALYDRETQNARKVSYATGYAFISPGAISTYGLNVIGLPGVYGSPHCNGLTPITGEWDCDPANWWQTDDGTPNDTIWGTVDGVATDVSATVGDTYTTRDVDCYDFSAKNVREQGVGWQLATLSAACAR